VAASILR